MAARTNKPLHDERTKRLIGATQLLKRLIAHANGEIEMTASQVQAAKVVIGKSIPDLKAIEVTGEVEHTHYVAEIPSAYQTSEEWQKNALSSGSHSQDHSTH